ncbi:L-arabinose transport system permease protein AraQ [compost metagenome]
MIRTRFGEAMILLALTAFGFVFIYPLLWLLFSSVKPNNEIFSSVGLIPTEFIWNAYAKGWQGIGKNGFSTFFLNSFRIVVPVVLLTALSSIFIAYGFARFRFPLKNLLFTLMLSTLMLPDAVIMIPRYLLYKNFGWLNTYLPFYIPSLLGVHAFFIYMLIQFLRGIPRELDEAAIMDGCGSFRILTGVLLPLCWPALVSVCLFQFLWTWNEFFNTLIYVNSVSKFPVSLGLRMVLDTEGAVHWNQVMAMAVVSMLPCILIFFIAQKQLTDSVATTGLKG